MAVTLGNFAMPLRAVVLNVAQYLGMLPEANRACRSNAARPDFLAPSAGQMRSGKTFAALEVLRGVSPW
jgi:hypothetical protein